MFRSRTPAKDDTCSYLNECLSVEDIYERISKYVTRFQDEDDLAAAFLHWVKKNQPDFVSLPITRKRDKKADGTEVRIRRRNMFVLNQKHWSRLLLGEANKNDAV